MSVMKPEPLVSIVCVAFNQAEYITAALEGFLQQQVDFRYEIIVHDDASTDGTSDIIRDYAERYPLVVVPVLQTENQYSKGNKPWTICFPLARGRYIALCEGDDRWIDPLKLQSQVDAMENDPDAAGSYTYAYNEVNGVLEPYHGGEARVPAGQRLDMATYLGGEGIPTCTFVFRRAMLKEPTGFIKGFATGDTALFTQLLLQGHFILQPKFSAVRLKHVGGVYSMRSSVHQLNIALVNRSEQNMLTGGLFSGILKERTRFILEAALNQAFRTGNTELARHAWSRIRQDTKLMRWSRWTTIRRGFKVFFPRTSFFLGSISRSTERLVSRLVPSLGKINRRLAN